jgi:hypothetical protein
MIKPRATTPIAALALNLFGLADWRLSFGGGDAAQGLREIAAPRRSTAVLRRSPLRSLRDSVGVSAANRRIGDGDHGERRACVPSRAAMLQSRFHRPVTVRSCLAPEIDAIGTGPALPHTGVTSSSHSLAWSMVPRLLMPSQLCLIRHLVGVEK